MKPQNTSTKPRPHGTATWIRNRSKQAIGWAKRSVPPGLRLLLGLLLIGGGIFGFLPILGFWMIPLGIAFVALDVRTLGRRLMTRLSKRK